jgi:hypothetical protein
MSAENTKRRVDKNGSTLRDAIRAGEIELCRGDIVCTSFPGAMLGSLVKHRTAIWARDGKASYGHALIIKDVGPRVTTFEALWKIGEYDFFDRYAGQKVFVARYLQMFMDDYMPYHQGMEAVRRFDGRRYPVWRLPLHLLGLAKFLHFTEMPVCSELVALFMRAACWDKPWGWEFERPYGWTPDTVHDFFRIWRRAQVVFEGTC